MTTIPAEPLLHVEGVTVRFGGLVALHEVGLRVRHGSVVGLIGPNGAGKTTLFNVISGLLTPQAGRITVAGRTLAGHRPYHLAPLGIARTLQGLNLFQGMTVLDNVIVGADRLSTASVMSLMTGLGAQRSDEAELRRRALKALADVGAEDVAHALPGTLPYGVQKKVALARALVADPELLLLDEPASGLSEEELSSLGDRIRALSGRMGVLLVEHHMDLVMSVCDEIVVLNFGEVICTGDPGAVRNDPAVAQAYLGQPVEVEG